MSTTTKRTAEALAAEDDSNDNNNNNKKTKTLSPYDQYFETQKEWLNKHKDILGMTMIKGVQNEDSDEDSYDDDDEEEDTSKYTAEQMKSLRCIMITQHRSDQLEKMNQLILKDQANHGFQSFTTSFSYDVLNSWPILQQRLARKTPAQRLDMLMAYTFVLHQNDWWMNDNEGNMASFVGKLAAAWKKLLTLDDETLKWDLEYTKPGVLSLLEQFKSDIESMSGLGKFNYQ